MSILAGTSNGETANAKMLAAIAHQDAILDCNVAALGMNCRKLLRDRPSLPLPGRGDTLGRWRTLARIAGQDVCVVKVLEAHHDALAILAELGAESIADSGLLAVWAAEPPDARVEFRQRAGGNSEISGTKAWCSGADLVTGALLTAHAGDQRCLVYVDMRAPGIEVDPAGWDAVGMARVASGRVRFDRTPALAIGGPGDYLSRAGFWHGGAGIAACWFGAAAAIGETLRGHARVGQDTLAAAHLGAIDVSLEASAALLRETAAMIDANPRNPHVDAVIRVRSLVERTCTDVIDRVGRALGPAPLCTDRAHALRCADLAVFVRQSHAERDWAALGKAAAARQHTWAL